MVDNASALEGRKSLVTPVVTVSVSEISGFAGKRHRAGDRRSGALSEKRCNPAGLRARGGCVWCVTVKDPRVVPNRRATFVDQSPREGRPEANGRSPWVTISTSKSVGRFDASASAPGARDDASDDVSSRC